jgi:hypothetical protein
MTFRPGSCDTGQWTFLDNMAPPWIYMSFHVVIQYSIFHRDDFDFPDRSSDYTVRLG